MQLPLDGSVEAEYESGYVHSETALNDISPYEPNRNVFYDILHQLPVKEHGKMVRFSCYYQNHRYDVDWRGLPDNARPIRFKQISRDFNAAGEWVSEPRINGVDFGYQYLNDQGENVQEVTEL